ncbi:MAG: hypothetical protein ACP5G4_09375, partial [bacterium]
DTLGAYADTSVVWDTLAAYSDTTITNLILDSLAIYLLENDTILYSDTAGFAWKIPCDSVNECIDWDTLGAYLDTLADDGDWADSTTFLMVIGQKGVFGNGNVGYGDHDSTHVNLGVAGTTGTSGSNIKYATISGGFNNIASGAYATIGGGHDNVASDSNATVTGGLENIASGKRSTVSGYDNEASGASSTVIGGGHNVASGHYSTVGGHKNVVSGYMSGIFSGDSSEVEGTWSFVGGGTEHYVGGNYSAIPGGLADTVSGNFSFAFGRNVNVSTDYTAQFNSPSYKGILRNYGNLEFSDTLVGGIGTADTFLIFDDGDTTRIESDNPIKIGDGSLIIGNNGYVYATKNLYAGDSLYIGDLELDTTDMVVLVADTTTGKVGYASMNFVGGAIVKAYGELIMDDTSGVTVALPNSSAWTDMKTAESGIIAGAPFITVGAGTDGSTAYADSLIIGDNGAHLYQMNLSVSFSGPSGCQFQMAILRDGVILPKFMLFSDIASANEKKSSSLSGLIEIDDGQILTVKMRNAGNKGINITIYNFNLQITRVGD